ncbi:MAG: hypothetical protein UHN47_03505 [Lachnospiraceae bacterium]|nr:hypothetical protein [Lachnospiraceae bacterium]
MTNLNKSREEIIYELLISINQGNSDYLRSDGEATPRIDLAIAQYDALVKRGVIKEE